MTDLNQKKWYTKNKFLVPITAILVAILTLFFTPIFNKWLADKRDDFKMSLNSVQGNVNQGESINISVNFSSFGKYENDITLSAIGQSSDMEVVFNPQTVNLKQQQISSTISIKTMSSTNVGDRDITIKGLDRDGLQHECQFKLKVTSSTIIPLKEILTTIDSNKIRNEVMEKNLYKITYGEKIFGYLKLPSDVTEITLYLMEGNSPKIGSTIYMEDKDGEQLNMISKDQFVNNLGLYIQMANDKNKKLIISADNGSNKWMTANKFRFGKDVNTLRYLKQIKMWHPMDEKVYNMTGWINYP